MTNTSEPPFDPDYNSHIREMHADLKKRRDEARRALQNAVFAETQAVKEKDAATKAIALFTQEIANLRARHPFARLLDDDR